MSIPDLVGGAGRAIDSAARAAAEAAQRAAEAAQRAAEAAQRAAEAAAQRAAETSQRTAANVAEQASEFGDKAASTAKQVGGTAKDAINWVGDRYNQAEDFKDSVGSAIDSGAKSVDRAVDGFQKDVEAFGKKNGIIGEIAAKAVSTPTGLVQGVVFGAYDAGKGVVQLVDGANQLANPMEWAFDSQDNVGRLEGLVNTGSTLGKLTSPLEWIRDPQGNSETVGALWDSLTEGYQKAIDDGDPGEFAGRLLFDVGSTLATGGAGAAAKSGQTATAASRLGQSASAVDKVADGAKVTNSLTPEGLVTSGKTAPKAAAGPAPANPANSGVNPPNKGADTPNASSANSGVNPSNKSAETPNANRPPGLEAKYSLIDKAIKNSPSGGPRTTWRESEKIVSDIMRDFSSQSGFREGSLSRKPRTIPDEHISATERLYAVDQAGNLQRISGDTKVSDVPSNDGIKIVRTNRDIYIEVKNYDIVKNRSALISKLGKQYDDRKIHLDPDTKATAVIDITGQTDAIKAKAQAQGIEPGEYIKNLVTDTKKRAPDLQVSFLLDGRMLFT